MCSAFQLQVCSSHTFTVATIPTTPNTQIVTLKTDHWPLTHLLQQAGGSGQAGKHSRDDSEEEDGEEDEDRGRSSSFKNKKSKSHPVQDPAPTNVAPTSPVPAHGGPDEESQEAEEKSGETDRKRGGRDDEARSPSHTEGGAKVDGKTVGTTVQKAPSLFAKQAAPSSVGDVEGGGLSRAQKKREKKKRNRQDKKSVCAGTASPDDC